MRAIIKDDLIVKIVGIGKGGIEIGTLPKENGLNIGLERIRWDGEKIVDLADLNEIWIDKNGIIHCIDVGGCQLIKIKYNQRKRLINDGTQWRLKTKKEINEYKNKEYSRRRRREYTKEIPIGDQLGVIMKYLSKQKDLDDELINMLNKIENIKKRWKKNK